MLVLTKGNEMLQLGLLHKSSSGFAGDQQLEGLFFFFLLFDNQITKIIKKNFLGY